jgi:hypothetical protein
LAAQNVFGEINDVIGKRNEVAAYEVIVSV